MQRNYTVECIARFYNASLRNHQTCPRLLCLVSNMYSLLSRKPPIGRSMWIQMMWPTQLARCLRDLLSLSLIFASCCVSGRVFWAWEIRSWIPFTKVCHLGSQCLRSISQSVQACMYVLGEGDLVINARFQLVFGRWFVTIIVIQT